LSLEVQGKLGHPIDLSGAVDIAAAANEARTNEAGISPDLPGAASVSATADQRNRERFRVDGLAEVVVGDTGVVFRGKTCNLSQTGCYIDSKGYLSASVGEEVEVRFSVSDVHLKALARVRVVKRGKGAGFEFLRVEEDAQNSLGSLLDRLGRPSRASPTELALDGGQ
jgi:hypothetical protein